MRHARGWVFGAVILTTSTAADGRQGDSAIDGVLDVAIAVPKRLGSQ